MLSEVDDLSGRLTVEAGLVALPWSLELVLFNLALRPPLQRVADVVLVHLLLQL